MADESVYAQEGIVSDHSPVTDPESSDVPTVVQDAAGAPARLLVIDDDTIHRMVICAVSEKLDYLPTAAASLDEAVKFLKEGTFDCITLDLSLGSRHGAEMLPIIAETGSNAPIVIISGANNSIRAETVRIAQMLKLNVTQLEKPVNLSVLRGVLSDLRRGGEATLVP